MDEKEAEARPVMGTIFLVTVFPRMLTADSISFRRQEAANTK